LAKRAAARPAAGFLHVAARIANCRLKKEKAPAEAGAIVLRADVAGGGA